MFDCVYNPKYSVLNSIKKNIATFMFYLFLSHFLFMPYYTVLAGNNLSH